MFDLKYAQIKNFRFCWLTVVLLALPTQSVLAGTEVRVNTSLGEFSLELFDEITPLTVANFLNYVTSGRYNGTVVHRSEPDFVIQGGWLTFDELSQAVSIIPTDVEVFNEFNVSNTRGTIAMAKIGGDPDSATSQWFINLEDNSFLDSSNGGFTVFGRVLGEGMDVVDAIGALPTALLAFQSPFPVINYTGGAVLSANLVEIEMSVVDLLGDAPNSYDAATGLLSIKVDAGTAGLISLSFAIVSTEPEAVIQALVDSVEALPNTVDKIATFDAATGQLTLPELVVDGVVAYRNMIFVLSDAEQLLFRLDSFEQ